MLACLVLVLQACCPSGVSATVVNKKGETVETFTFFYEGGTVELTDLEPHKPQTVMIPMPPESPLAIELAGQKKEIDIYVMKDPCKTLDLTIEEGNVVNWTYHEEEFFWGSSTTTGTARDI